jgi:hypothetical protein
MTDWIFSVFAGGQALPKGSREWVLESEGLSAGWAFFLFLLLGAACVWAYFKCAPSLPRYGRLAMAGLRLAALALVLILLARPVLHLTINEPVRQSLLVLVDASQSMLLNDRRSTPDDLKRAALAAGLADPAEGLKGAPPSGAAALQNINRWELLQKLAANTKLDLWKRLAEKSDLVFYRAGRDAVPAGSVTQEQEGAAPDAGPALGLFTSAKPEEPVTALGESMRQVLEQNRGLPVGGILVITDGASNSGLPPVEAARMAREQNIPLFLYGVGVTSPIDLVVRSATSPQIAFVKERTEVAAKLRAQGLGQRKVKGVLKANGKIVDTQEADLREDGEYEVVFHYEPAEAGDSVLEAAFDTAPEEMSKDNNAASTKIRIVDKKIKVLYIEQEPRWDFRYLLAFLQRDRRLEVKAVLIDSGPGTENIPDSPFLPALPGSKEEIFKYEILILGDVNPKDLGEARMKLIREWVGQANGGMIFLAGGKFNPSQYASTPLEALLPVVPDTSFTPARQAERAKELFKLQLTPAGERSSYLRMADDEAENLKIWQEFPGVRWTAAVAKAKPGAEVLLTDARSERALSGSPMPVMAIQSYGSGEAVFIGTDETYRWRSRKGEAYYSQVWSSIMQSLSIKRLQGASTRTQLKSDRERYFVGDKIIVSGKVYQEGFEPMTAGILQGRVRITGEDAAGKPVERTSPFDVSAVSDQPGEYRGEITAQAAGRYVFSTLQDPEAVVKFEVIEPKIEQMETALNERLLRTMAEAANGKFLREEDLAGLPALVASQSATVATFKKISLYHSPWWMALLFLALFAEWLLRRLKHLK